MANVLQVGVAKRVYGGLGECPLFYPLQSIGQVDVTQGGTVIECPFPYCGGTGRELDECGNAIEKSFFADFCYGRRQTNGSHFAARKCLWCNGCDRVGTDGFGDDGQRPFA